MPTKIKQLQEERTRLITQAQGIMAKEGAMTKEEEAKFDLLMIEADQKKVEIDRWQKLHEATAEQNLRVAMRAGRENISVEEKAEQEAKQLVAFSNWLRGGMEAL